MKQEIPDIKKEGVEKFEKPEDGIDRKEPKPEDVISAWSEMVVTDGDIPENISEMGPDDIKKWLFDSVMKDTDKLIDDLEINIDTEKIRAIKESTDLDKKTELELEYIEDIRRQMNKAKERFQKNNPGKGVKWDSWPKAMRETKGFNCAGAALIGMNLLERAGIESYYGNPANHALNIVRTADGGWQYVDLLNNDVKKIENPEETVANGVRVLKIDQPNIMYKLMPIYDNLDSSGVVIGNLSAIGMDENQDIHDGDTDKEKVDKEVARKFTEEYSESFKKIDFGDLQEKLFKNMSDMDGSKEMEQERTRINDLRNADKPLLEYMETLSPDQKIELISDVKNNKRAIEVLLQQERIPENVSEFEPELNGFINFFSKTLRDMKEKQPEIAQDLLDRVVKKIQNI